MENKYDIPLEIQPLLFDISNTTNEIITIYDLYKFVDRHIQELWINKVSNNFYVLGNWKKKPSIQIMLKGDYINKVRPTTDWNYLFERDAMFGIIDHLYTIEGENVGLKAIRDYDPKRNKDVTKWDDKAWNKETKYIIF